MYKLRKRFTTVDGIVHKPDPRPYGITQADIDEFGPIMPPDKGCASCIFVRLEGGIAKDVFFETTGGHHETHPIDGWGWAHSNMYGPGSCYDPEAGQVGPWSVQAVGVPSEIVDGIGLPQCHHVSTWAVLTWFDDDGGTGDGDGGPEPVDPPVDHVPTVQVTTQGDHVKVSVDGTLVYEYGS